MSAQDHPHPALLLPCEGCGRRPGPNMVVRGWSPCGQHLESGHLYQWCVTGNGGCGTVRYDPPKQPRCSDPRQGFRMTQCEV